MSSNYDFPQTDETVREEQDPGLHEVRCNACRGLGWVLVYDQETDCLECEGYGSVLVRY